MNKFNVVIGYARRISAGILLLAVMGNVQADPEPSKASVPSKYATGLPPMGSSAAASGPRVPFPPSGTSSASADGPAGIAMPLSQGLQPDFAMVQALPRAYSRPASEWQRKEITFYEKALSSGKFDVLVAPFQVSGWGLDRATRSLMTAELVAALARAQKVAVPDAYLVAKALGEGERRYEAKDIFRLADVLGAQRVIQPSVGHDRAGKMSVVLSISERAKSGPQELSWTGPKTIRQFDGIVFDNEGPAIQAFEALLPDLVKSMGWEPVAPVTAKVDAKAVKLDLLASPKAMLSVAESSPARDAYVYLLFAGLTPDMQERTREQFAEKALLALTRLSPNAPDYKDLRARAYMTVGLRMAAITVLGAPVTDEERELLAALNGNLPDVRKYASLEKNPWKRLMQKRDEIEIAHHYGLGSRKEVIEAVTALDLPGDIWPYIATRALLDWDRWMQFDNVATKALLDSELPVKGLSLENMVGGGVTQKDDAKLRTAVDLSVINHGRKWLEGNLPLWCCSAGARTPGLGDFLELASAVGHSNLMQRIQFYNQIQGRNDTALQFANSIDVVYQGHPYYTVSRAQVEAALVSELAGAEREGMRKAAHEHAFNAMYWEQGQSLVSDLARRVAHGTGLQPYGYHDALYYEDLPFRPYFWTWAAGGNTKVIERNEVEALKGARWEFSTVASLVQSYRAYHPGEPMAEAVLKSVEQRFLGSPQRNTWLAADALRHGDAKRAREFHRDNIRLAPSYWYSYAELGRMAFEMGEVDEASKIYLSYPGFQKNSDANRVGVANDAFEAGSRFYWSGHFDLAKPLYEIAVAQATGAGGDLASGLRLKLLAGDIDGAMAGSLERAQRYNDSYAYRDFLGILHAKGQATRAWEGFGQLVRESKRPHLWETALVGHHMGKATEDQVVQWASQDTFKDVGPNLNAAAVYVLRFACTDRTPTAELAQEVQRLDRSTWQLEDYHDKVVRAPIGAGTGAVAGPTLGGRGAVLPIGVFDRARKHQVRSDLAYFAQAYRAIQLKDYAGAKSIFDEAAKLYDFSAQPVYTLPYYAIAAAKTGDTAGVETLLKGEVARGFDAYLAKAVLHGVAGDADKALESLRFARYRRPHTEDRPLLTQYTLGEIAEWVAEQTGDARIRQLALEWAQKAQQFEPWQAWSYAIEARLAPDPQQRQWAIAMTYYLDPQSQRLSVFSAAEIEAAVKASQGRNPFLPRAVKSKGGAAI